MAAKRRLSNPGRGSAETPRSCPNPGGSNRDAIRKPSGDPRATQGPPKGYPRKQQGSSAGAPPEQHQSLTLAAAVHSACVRSRSRTARAALKRLAPVSPSGYNRQQMAEVAPNPPPAGKPARISYWFVLCTLVLVGWLHLATPLLVAFFGYLALTKLHFVKRGGKSLAVALFLILVSALAHCLGHFVKDTVREIVV